MAKAQGIDIEMMHYFIIPAVGRRGAVSRDEKIDGSFPLVLSFAKRSEPLALQRDSRVAVLIESTDSNLDTPHVQS